MGSFLVELIGREVDGWQEETTYKRKVRVQMSDLRNGRMADLRDFCKDYKIDVDGLKQKMEIIQQIQQSENILIDHDVVSVFSCQSCQEYHDVRDPCYRLGSRPSEA